MSNVLVVEDDRLLGKAIEEKFIKSGFDVTWSRSADDAFKVLESEEIKIVFLDLVLPGEMDGFEILRKMKNDPKLKTIPVIILSNLGEMAHVDRALELGALDYIVKAATSLKDIVQIAENRLISPEVR